MKLKEVIEVCQSPYKVEYGFKEVNENDYLEAEVNNLVIVTNENDPLWSTLIICIKKDSKKTRR